MKDALYFIMDMLDYGIRGWFLVYLCEEIRKDRFQFLNKKIIWVLIGGQFALVQLFVSNSPIVKRLLFGDDLIPASSKPSILCIAISLSISLVFCLILYKGNRMGIIYLLVTFYALMELVRFTIYSFSICILNLLIDFHLYLFEKAKFIGSQELKSAIDITQGVWNFTVTVMILSILYVCLKRYKNYLFAKKHQLELTEISFLAVPSVIGLALSVLLRCILYSQKGNEIHALLTDNPEMNVIVPLISILCIIAIMLSAKILSIVVADNEEKLKLEIYQDRIHGMEEHMKDVERLYDGIRGMKHDMKNYIADIEDLLGEQSMVSARNVKELKEYLSGLTNSIEKLDIKYQTGNPVTDVVVNRYVRQAEEKQILFESEFIFPTRMAISAFDLSIILNNALENAVEACEKSESENRYITIESYSKRNMFFIEIKNSFNGILKYNKEKGILDTTKENMQVHGLGMKNINNCVEKYYGKAQSKVKDREFCLLIMLQGKQNR